MNIVIIIPARMKSSRLPGKPLVEIMGQSLLERTWCQCCKAYPANKIYVATDDQEIKEHCNKIGMQVIMTSQDCLTGTDRVAEAAKQIDADCYINVQGDEPLIDPDDITKVIDVWHKYPNQIVNGYTTITDEIMWRSTSMPKVVLSEQEDLLYMSRAPIPNNKNGTFEKAWRQVCIYAFPKKALELFANRNQKTCLESIEDIEILRFVEMGLKVKMVKLSSASIPVDHPEDVEKVIERLKTLK